jgi:Phosphorylated CTD interacting factor 1 WW domain
MALRGDHDIFSLMDEMSTQQGYQTTKTAPQQKLLSSPAGVATPVSRVRLVPEVKGHPSKKSVGSRQIWNPYPKVESATEAVLLAPTNPQVEVFRRRAYERFKEEFREMFDRANGNSKKDGPGNLWNELSLPSLIERWQFDAKLNEYLDRTIEAKKSVCKPSGLWTTAQVQGFMLSAIQNTTWIDPILVSSRNPRGPVHPFVEELKFEWTRAWRRKCGVKSRDAEVERTFLSKKFLKKSRMLSRCIRETTQVVDTKMMDEIRKRATLESTQQFGKKLMLPKLTFQDDDVKVTYSGLIFTVHKQHYHKLQIMYDRQNPTSSNREDHEAGFVAALFALLARYDMLQGAGLQSALQGSVFDYLLQEFDSTMECFASPLNCRYERFCSAFPDTDAVFGSVGSFFDYDFSGGGCFQANPPFVANFILAMYRRMHDYLEKTSKELMFVVFVPAWTETTGWKALAESCYLGHHELMTQESHYYAEGTQHRRKDRFRVASFDTSVFFLQNEAAKAKWTITKDRLAKLREAFVHNPDEEDDPVEKEIVKEGKSSGKSIPPKIERSPSAVESQRKLKASKKDGYNKRKAGSTEEQSQQLLILESMAEKKRTKR